MIATLPGITNYPIGVGINGAGEITIADNHNNFNLSVFSQDGQLISALESKVVAFVRFMNIQLQIGLKLFSLRGGGFFQ